MIDIHNHIIPGIDDGAQTLEDSIELLKLAVDNGIQKLVCTPHMHAGRFDNDVDTILPHFIKLLSKKNKLKLPIEIAMAAEVRISDEFMMQLKKGRVPMLGQWEGADCVLLEMPHAQIPMGIDNLINWLKRQNIRPVIAHPERNKEIMRYPERAQALADKGVLFQLTAASVSGQFGSQAEEISQWLLDKKLVQFVASDAHNTTRRPPAMKAAAGVLDTWVGEEERIKLTHTNPDVLTQSIFLKQHSQQYSQQHSQQHSQQFYQEKEQ